MRNCRNGAWLTVVPSRLNGTDLSANEFRDNIRLRYNLKPLDMPSHCDGCGAKLTVEHAMSCKVGGLVHCRHDTTSDEFRHLAGCAFGFNKVEREPRIYGVPSSRIRAMHNDDEATSTPPANTPLSTAQAHDRDLQPRRTSLSRTHPTSNYQDSLDSNSSKPNNLVSSADNNSLGRL